MTNAADVPDLASVIAGARARGAFVHTMDGTRLRDKLSTLDAIASALSFPDWFGRNLDALYDCLTDLSWLPAGEHVLVWVSADRLAEADPRSYLAIRSVLSDAQRALGPSEGRSDRRQFSMVLATPVDGSGEASAC